MEAKFVLVKLCTSFFVRLRHSEILSMCYSRNGLYLKIRANETFTSEIRASQGPLVSRLRPKPPPPKLSWHVNYECLLICKNGKQQPILGDTLSKAML